MLDIGLLQKFFRNECSEEEVKEVISWFNDPEKRELALTSIELNWYRFEDQEIDKQKAIADIKQKINARLSSQQPSRIRTIRNMPVFWKVAAVVALLIGASYLWRQQIHTQPQTISSNALSESYIVKANPKGRKLKMLLSDGSTVYLNSESKISFRENFGDTTRQVYLEGEAYFQVAKNVEVPFVVYTRNLTITALGTSFNVKTYSEDTQAYVALETGKALVKRITLIDSMASSVILNPGQTVSYDKLKERLSPVREFDYNEQLAWKEGVLYFNEDSFSEVTKKLERWYGVEIVILNQDKAHDWYYSGTFKDVSLENVLTGISYTKSFEYEINNGTIYIKFNS